MTSYSLMTFSITTLSPTILRIITFILMTLSITIFSITIKKRDTQYNNTEPLVKFMLSIMLVLLADCRNGECHYAECHGAASNIN
jgi:hypothetical protein